MAQKIVSFFILMFCSCAAYLQLAETQTTAEGQSFQINRENEIAEFTLQFVNSKGEVMIAFYKGSKIVVQKYDAKLNYSKEIILNPFDVTDTKGEVDPLGGYFYQMGDVAVVISQRTELGTKLHTRHVCFLDSDLNPLGGGWQLLSKHSDVNFVHRTTTSQFKQMAQIGPIHINNSGLVGLIMDNGSGKNGEDLIHTIIRFNERGEKVYSKEVHFNQSQGEVVVFNGSLMGDGSFVYFGQQKKRLFYKVISADGEELQEELEFQDDEFILFDIIPNPSNDEAFVLIGVNEDLHPVIYYFSMSGFSGYDNFAGKSIVPIIPEEFSEFYISSWKAKIVNDKLYFAAVVWDGGFKEGWNVPTNTLFTGFTVDLTSAKLKVETVTQRVSEIEAEKPLAPFPNQATEIYDIAVVDNYMILSLRVYQGATLYGGPYGSFTYTDRSYKYMTIDVANSEINYPDEFAPTMKFSSIKDGKLVNYSIRYDDENPEFKKTKVCIGTTTYDLDGKELDILCHFPETIKWKDLLKVFAVFEESNGGLSIYFISTGKSRVLVKVPVELK